MIKKNIRIYKVLQEPITQKAEKFSISKSDYIRMVMARYCFSDFLFEEWCKENEVPVEVWEGQKSCPPFDGSTEELFFSTSDAIEAWKDKKYLKMPIELKDTVSFALSVEEDLWKLFTEKVGNFAQIVILTLMFLQDLAITELVEWYAALNTLEVEPL